MNIENWYISNCQIQCAILPVVSAVLIVTHLKEDALVDENDETDVVGSAVEV